MSELLWLNRDRIRNKQSIHGVRQVVLPTNIHRDNQRITLIHQHVGRQHARAINQIKHILHRYNLQMNWHLGELEQLATKIDSLDANIMSRSQGDQDVELFRTIPGVAYFTALALSSRIGDPKRFASGKGLSDYWGLTPSVEDSGNTTGRRGRITKAGSRVARWLLGKIVVHVLRKDPLPNCNV